MTLCTQASFCTPQSDKINGMEPFRAWRFEFSPFASPASNGSRPGPKRMESEELSLSGRVVHAGRPAQKSILPRHRRCPHTLTRILPRFAIPESDQICMGGITACGSCTVCWRSVAIACALRFPGLALTWDNLLGRQNAGLYCMCRSLNLVGIRENCFDPAAVRRVAALRFSTASFAPRIRLVDVQTSGEAQPLAECSRFQRLLVDAAYIWCSRKDIG